MRHSEYFCSSMNKNTEAANCPKFVCWSEMSVFRGKVDSLIRNGSLTQLNESQRRQAVEKGVGPTLVKPKEK